MPPKVLVTGPVRSGKSRHAQALAERLASVRTFVATGRALDAEMADRIARHQSDRDGSWRTLEAPVDLVGALAQAEGVALVDCLTLWVTNLLLEGGEHAPVDAPFRALVEAVVASPVPVILVTNEVGWGIVPDNSLARAFRDHSGRLSQALAARVDAVHLVVAGLPLALKGSL